MMQFEPSTFARYARPVPPGGASPPSPFDPTDEVYAAARYLCSLGAPADIRDALVAYNCGNAGTSCQSASGGYAAEVINLAVQYETGSHGHAPQGRREIAVAYAESQLGVAYRWGGETPGSAFDCSGLVQWAFGQAGVALPRTAHAQYDSGAHLPPAAPLEAGDLVYFGSGPASVDHVGVVLVPGVMIDAPHAGAVVREEPFPTHEGAAWGLERYLGADRPAG
jgi:cell wall-associated NlpC family hydrolase